MKKSLLFMAALAFVACFAVSCNKNNPEDGSGTEVVFTEPEHSDDALSITFNNTNEPLQLGNELVIPEKLIFTEGGTFIFVGERFAKAVTNKFTLSGNYTVSGGVYSAPGLGSVSVSGANVSIQPAAGGEKKDYNADVTEPAAPSGTTETNLVRDWKPSGKVKVEIPSKGISTSLEPNLESIAAYLAEHGVNIKKEEYAGYEIDKISLSLADKTFSVAFANKTAYVGIWKWVDQNAGKFSYTFDAQMGSELINGTSTGTVSFSKSGSTNMCSFVMEITAKGVTANLQFSLVEA